MASFEMHIVVKGQTADMVSVNAIREVGQRTANEVLAMVRLLPNFGNVGVPIVGLQMSVNHGPFNTISFINQAPETVEAPTPKKENPFDTM